MGHPGKTNPKNLSSPAKGTTQKRTILRRGMLERVEAEWDRRDVLAQLGLLVEGEKLDGFLATLSKSEFLQVVLKVLPRQTDVNVNNGADALKALLKKAGRE